MFKLFTKSDYLLKETFLGLQRGGWMNWAAVSTVTVLLFLFGMSLQTSWQLEKLLNQFGNQLEVSVYLEPSARLEMIEPIIAQMPQVAHIQTITKEQAWTKLVQDLGISNIDGATGQLGDNPLVDELKVKAQNSSVVTTLATQLAKLRGVDAVQYVDEAVKRVSQLQQGLNWLSLTITMILTITAVAVTSTTIRLIVVARHREIEVMQLVGATSVWIYLPFTLQGIVFGVIGGTIAWGFISCLQQFLSRSLAHQPDFLQFLANGLQLTALQTFLLPGILLSFGTVVGCLGSLFALHSITRT